jgi:hypothetical protein
MKNSTSTKIIVLLLVFVLGIGIGYGVTKMMNNNIHHDKVQELTKGR